MATISRRKLGRRDFAKCLSGSLAAIGSLTLQSCATTRAGSRRSAPEVDVRYVLRRVDELNESIATGPVLAEPSRWVAERGLDPMLVRDSMQALLLVGVFRDLSPRQRRDPLMQERLWQNAGLFDRTVLGMATLLEGLGREERRAIRTTLREKPQVLRRFQTALDVRARELHAPSARIDHMHKMMNAVASRFARGSVSGTIDEFVDKVDKVSARFGITPELRRQLAGEWNEELVAQLAQSVDNRLAQAGRGDYWSGDSESRVSRGRHVTRVGLVMFGIGLMVGMLSALTFFGDAFFVGIVGMTLAGLLLLAGLVVLVVGGSISASG